MPHAAPRSPQSAKGQGPTGGRIILIQPLAPPKPPAGQACNGCGVCCTAAPCPLGAWLSHSRTGACKALNWDAAATEYRCGALAEPEHWLPWLPAAWARRLVRRWIAAAQRCDCSLQVDCSGSSPA